MIITRTPFRISFFGGGTDFPQWYLENGGSVLSTSIDKYSYISCRKLPQFFQHKHRIVYSKLEYVNSVNDIEHPAIKGILNEYHISDGLEIHCDADLPARSGLGSSSAFIVGMINALKAMDGVSVSKEWLAKEAIRIEQNVLKEVVGSQDQMAVAIGGFNKFSFNRDASISCQPLMISSLRKKELNSHLMLFFTGFSRFASEIEAEKLKKLNANKQVLNKIHSLVDDAVDVLTKDCDIQLFGEMLHETWVEKIKLSRSVSNTQIDEIYKRARKSGAIGGKLLGAGGGGFILLFVKPQLHENVKVELKDLIHVPFSFEDSGSQIIYHN